jgi:hypothetical protein
MYDDVSEGSIAVMTEAVRTSVNIRAIQRHYMALYIRPTHEPNGIRWFSFCSNGQYPEKSPRFYYKQLKVKASRTSFLLVLCLYREITFERLKRNGQTLLPSKGPRRFGMLPEPTNQQPIHIKNKTWAIPTAAGDGNNLRCSALVPGTFYKVSVQTVQFSSQQLFCNLLGRSGNKSHYS